MNRNLPPLNALKVFESAARNLSFTKAADELFITQGAISKQIKILEQYLGFALFKRVHRGLILTDKALKYYQDVHIIFNKIGEATNNIQSGALSCVLNLNVLPSISSLVIAPNIASFKEEYGQNINLNLKASDDDISSTKENADIFIRCSKENFANFQNIKLVEEEMLMISSVKISKQITKISDIAKQNIIEHGSRPHILENWIKQNSLNMKNITKEIPTKVDSCISGRKPDKSNGINIVTENKISFEHFFMMIEAVRNHVGIGFIPSFLVNKMIQKGELVNVLNINYQTGYKYYLLYKQSNPEIKMFCKWFEQLLRSYKTRLINL